MKRMLVIAGAATCLTGCSNSGAGAALADNNMAIENLMAENLVAEDLPPVKPVPYHNYKFREGDTYGYVTAISEEDQKRGRAVGDVLMYRYGGFSDGVYRLETLSDDGGIAAVAECASPCVAIKYYDGSGLRRIPYDPGSVIGAAFQDAMRGMLVKGKAPRSYEPPAAPYSPPTADQAASNLVVENLTAENLVAENRDDPSTN